VNPSIRIIPCLDVTEGRVVKGINFTNLQDAGDPVEMARVYGLEGADELTFLDISASTGNRQTTYDVVSSTAEQVFIPLTVGGGVRTVADVDKLLRAGADKISVNTAAIQRPELLSEITQQFGAQVLVLSVDARRGATSSSFELTTHGGTQGTGIDAIDWVKKACDLGIGEILLNSMDADGTRAGYDLEMIQVMRPHISTPLIAEYEAVLKRGQLRLTDPEIDDVIDFLCASAQAHEIFYLWRPVLKDPDDDFLLELAIKSGACVVTWNVSDFKNAASLGVAVMTPAEFLQQLET
jgi:cyclase